MTDIEVGGTPVEWSLDLDGGPARSVQASNAGVLARLARAVYSFSGFAVPEASAEVSVLLLDLDSRFRGADETFQAGYIDGELQFDEDRRRLWSPHQALISAVEVAMITRIEGVDIPGAIHVQSGIAYVYDADGRAQIAERGLTVALYADLWAGGERLANERAYLEQALEDIESAMGGSFAPAPAHARLASDGPEDAR